MRERFYETMGTSIIYSTMSPPFIDLGHSIKKYKNSESNLPSNCCAIKIDIFQAKMTFY